MNPKPLFKDYQAMQNLKDQFGFFNNQAFVEIKKVLDEKCSSYLTNFKVFTDFKKSQLKKVCDNSSVWPYEKP